MIEKSTQQIIENIALSIKRRYAKIWILNKTLETFYFQWNSEQHCSGTPGKELEVLVKLHIHVT